MDKFLYDRDHRHERVNGLSRLLHERTYFQRNDKPKQWLPSLYLLIVQNQVAFCKRNSILKKKKKKSRNFFLVHLSFNVLFLLNPFDT